MPTTLLTPVGSRHSTHSLSGSRTSPAQCAVPTNPRRISENCPCLLKPLHPLQQRGGSVSSFQGQPLANGRLGHGRRSPASLLRPGHPETRTLESPAGPAGLRCFLSSFQERLGAAPLGICSGEPDLRERHSTVPCEPLCLQLHLLPQATSPFHMPAGLSTLG